MRERDESALDVLQVVASFTVTKCDLKSILEMVLVVRRKEFKRPNQNL